MLSHLVTHPKAKKKLLVTPSSARFTRMAKEMEWSTTSNVENIRGAFMPPPCLESNSSNSLHSFNYDPYAGIRRAISIPESENIINAYQCPSNNNNNEMMMMMMFKKKQRLTNGQLDSLEQSFQEDIKLDSNRKLKLSKELGLQPRQVAVWFQNRRARWKVKHLEESYDSIKQEYDVVSRENQMLHYEVKKLRGIILKDHLMKMQSNQNNNQISGQYNNPMLVGSSTLWPSISQPPYPW